MVLAVSSWAVSGLVADCSLEEVWLELSRFNKRLIFGRVWGFSGD